jgi:drug/metabolite transporter superfamily protein YnfA
MVLILALFGALLVLFGAILFLRHQKVSGGLLIAIGGSLVVLSIIALMSFHP